jgi:hypothetical protein
MSDLVPKPEGNISDYYEGSADRVVTRSSGGWLSLMISNDGASSLTINVGGIIQTIKAGEVFDDNFPSFRSVSIVSTVEYRLWLRE